MSLLFIKYFNEVHNVHSVHKVFRKKLISHRHIPLVEWTFNIVKILQIQKCFFPKNSMIRFTQVSKSEKTKAATKKVYQRVNLL